MKTIIARNVNDALEQGIKLIRMDGEPVDSRVGKTLEIPCPVATVYDRPWERVLISKERDANPFFHLMEALWILQGRDDTAFLCEFNKRMVDYSDDGEIFNAPYGYRLRNTNGIDQLEEIIHILSTDPNSRQAVCQIWYPRDLTKDTKDKACNMSIVFRVRKNKLCMTVYNRSNDMIWGAYGANMVQFSMIQEYVAAHLGLEMGEYTQITNSYHVYTDGPGGVVWDRIKNRKPTCENIYVSLEKITSMGNFEIKEIDNDLERFFEIYDEEGLEGIGNTLTWESYYFHRLVLPVLCVFLVHKDYGPNAALSHIIKIEADDWRMACRQWLEARVK